jgi:hypothetical protein
MSKHYLATALCAALGLIGSTGLAQSEPIGRYECSVVGNGAPEPIGDRAGHNLTSMQFNCRGTGGQLKGAVYTAISVSEWDGPNGTLLLGGGTHRAAGGFAVSQLVEGTSSVIVKDGKPVGMTSAGKAMFKSATGTLAPLAGKPFKFTTKSTAANQFEFALED